MIKNIVEEYLETILYLTRGGGTAKTKDIADAMGVKPPSVSEMLAKLGEEGYVDYRPYVGASLTEKGRTEAARMERRHQLLETFLVDTLGVERDQAHHEACELEHAISDSTTARICSFLGHPRFCPDDHPITAGECCAGGGESLPLSGLKEGESATIQVVCADRRTRDFLVSLGFLPDVLLSIRKRLPSNSLLVRIKGSEIAIGGDIAEKILVKKAPA